MNFLDEYLETEPVGVSENSEYNKKIINEAIILESLGNDKNSLLKVFEKVGKYASRDGVLCESAETDIKVASFDTDKCSETAAILAAAKEANSPEYDLYAKAILLMNACMDKMKESFSNTANAKVEECKKELENNARVSDAIDEVKEEKKEECCCK